MASEGISEKCARLVTKDDKRGRFRKYPDIKDDRHTAYWTYQDCKNLYSGNGAVEGRGGTYFFLNSKLVKIDVGTSDFDMSFDQVVVDLSKKFGTAKIWSDTVQNNYGAQFSVGRASWTLPDGGIASAKEDVTYLGSGVGYRRFTNVVMETADGYKAYDPAAKAEEKHLRY